jgi:hypothetical protein
MSNGNSYTVQRTHERVSILARIHQNNEPLEKELRWLNASYRQKKEYILQRYTAPSVYPFQPSLQQNRQRRHRKK